MKKVIVSDNGVITSNGKAHYIDVLPDDFTELQYVSVTGKTASDTGIVVQDTDTIFVTFELGGLNKAGDKFIISNRGGATTGTGLWIENYGNANTWYVRFGSTGSVNKAPTTAQKTGVHILELRKGYFGVDGVSYLTPSYSSMPDSTLNVGGRLAASGTGVTGSTGNLYEVKVVDANGEPRWWGIPVKDSNNIAGFYDMVKDAFHKSNTSYPFIAGPIKQ